MRIAHSGFYKRAESVLWEYQGQIHVSASHVAAIAIATRARRHALPP